MANSRRRDPSSNFNFLVTLAALVGSVASVAIIRKLFARAERRAPGVYIEEVPAGARPIEGVGTSTAGFVGASPEQTKR